MTIKQLRVVSDDDLIEAHDEVASYHRLGWLPDEDRGDGGGAMAVTGISRFAPLSGAGGGSDQSHEIR